MQLKKSGTMIRAMHHMTPQSIKIDSENFIKDLLKTSRLFSHEYMHIRCIAMEVKQKSREHASHEREYKPDLGKLHNSQKTSRRLARIYMDVNNGYGMGVYR